MSGLVAAAGWTIRPATGADCAALALVGAATFLETYAGIIDGDAIIAHCAREHSEAAYAALLAQGACGWLALAATGDAPIGYALLTEPDLPGAQAGDLELKRIYALSRCHGTGVGKALMAEALAAAHGYQRILLGVYQGNARARSFYARHGFTEIDSRKFNVGGILHDDVVLARDLACAEAA